MTSTLLFAQQGIKTVVLTDECITVYYVDGGEPLHINSDDKMYAFHLKQFQGLEEQNLKSMEAEANKPADSGEQTPNE